MLTEVLIKRTTAVNWIVTGRIYCGFRKPCYLPPTFDAYKCNASLRKQSGFLENYFDNIQREVKF